MPIVRTHQDPVGKKDIRINNNWDIVIKKNGDTNEVALTGETNVIETYMQILRMCLTTKRGTYSRNQQFGCSPRGKKFKVTDKALADIRSYIKINLDGSYFNQKDYVTTVDVFAINNETIAVTVNVFFPGNKLGSSIGNINVLFDESTQELRTVFKAFGE